ncbi:MAG: type I-C CRISPR-associated protein Cas8c/Csd1 [Spirochaetales bacterium]|nr:type I-C CRISPR-associated protein Cas8c/Csd1 [Spirochaetales bacterium]
MILQALKEYYDRKLADPESGIAPGGWVSGGLDFLIEIDPKGDFVGIESLQTKEGKKNISKPMLLPNIGTQALKHANSGKDANLLWDNAAFVFGLGDKGDLRLSSMISVLDEWFSDESNDEIESVKTFLRKGLADRNYFLPITKHSEYGEQICTGQPKLSFRIRNSKFSVIFESEYVKKIINKKATNMQITTDVPIGTCLITGDKEVPIELTHTVIKGVWGAQSAGATIVGFNKDSFNSYGKMQAMNAPVSKAAVSSYVTGLNYLLGSDQRLQVGDASTVFWSERKTNFESDFGFFFKEPEKDDPSANTNRILNLFNSVHSGAYMEDNGEDKFFVLGLAPNAARISVRFWQVGTVSEFAMKIRQHFEDLRIIKPANEPEFYSIWRLLVNIATLDKSENIPPNIAGDFMRSILNGTAYPTSLLQAALRRIRSDTEYRVKPVRAALIKAYLNRYYRFGLHNKKEKEIAMALDIEQPSIGYQLGRLFAALEKIQEEANPSLNATIRERYYGAACSSPVTVFSNLMRLKNHHLAKMENKGRVVNLERLVGEIVGRFDDFPAHLDLHEQGKFAIGYYHQRQDFFVKKEKIEQE